MIDIAFFGVIGVTITVLFLFWYANYSTQSGFATDDNKNNIPDSWEKYALFFKLKNLIILLLGVLIGYLFSLSSF